MMKKLVALSSMALLLVASQYDGVGVRKSGLNAGSENLPKIEYTNQAPIPGQVTKYKKSFVTAPPMIPHSTTGMVPIKIGKNQCVLCHMPNAAKRLNINSIPKDHFVDSFKNGKKVGMRVAGSRYNCTQCHAPQAKVDPVVENKFKSLRK